MTYENGLPSTAQALTLIRSPLEVPVQTYLGPSLQVIDILSRLLDYLGPSELWQSTFSVSEEFLRRFHHLRKKGRITHASVLLDHKACRKLLHLWPFISRTFEKSWLGDNHSKILLLRSQKGHTVSVITSQNLTRGNRTESSVILSSPHTFASLLAQFNGITTYRSVPLADLIGTR